MRVKLIVEYDGTDFCGWQTQPGLRTVQSELESAIAKIAGESVRVTASGRTDAGVHALGQVVHFDASKELGAKYAGALNYYLPHDVRVRSAQNVGQDFHARFSAVDKTYFYLMYESKTDSAVLRNRAARVEHKLNVAAMDRAAKEFCGKHDFAAFMSSGSDTLTTVRTVTGASVKRKDGLIVFTVSADGFLYNMVRKMSAALIEVGKGKMTADGIKALLSHDATFTFVAPPQGLYLYKVVY